MSEDIDEGKRWWRKVIMISSGFVLIVALLLYGLAIFSLYIGKGNTHPLTYIVDIAVGLANSENEYHGVRDINKDPVTCTSQFPMTGRLSTCVALFDRENFAECAWWRLEKCVVLEGESYLLTRPDLLGKAMAAIHDPCRYAPTLEEIENATPTDMVWRRQMLDWRGYFGCGGFPADPRVDEYTPERVFVKLFDDQGNVVFKMEKPMPK